MQKSHYEVFFLVQTLYVSEKENYIYASITFFFFLKLFWGFTLISTNGEVGFFSHQFKTH